MPSFLLLAAGSALSASLDLFKKKAGPQTRQQTDALQPFQLMYALMRQILLRRALRSRHSNATNLAFRKRSRRWITSWCWSEQAERRRISRDSETQKRARVLTRVSVFGSVARLISHGSDTTPPQAPFKAVFQPPCRQLDELPHNIMLNHC